MVTAQANRERVSLGEAESPDSQKMEALTQLAGKLAHDFNNLVMVMSGNVHLLKQRVAGVAGSTPVVAMEQALSQTGNLTRQLLSVTRREAMERKPLHLRDEVASIRQILSASIRPDIDLSIEIADDTWPIEVDAKEFEAALLNLAANACDAMPEGGKLTISIVNRTLDCQNRAGERRSGDFVCVGVSDTGKGIPAAIIDRVFEPLFTTKETDEASGLGLSQVYGFCNHSEGLAKVTSEEGRGTTITLCLPCSRAMLARAGVEAQPAATVLLAEDNSVVGEVAEALLQDFGYTVKRAITARQALEILGDGQGIDVVFTDIVMEGQVSGLDLAQTVRNRCPTMPVLLTTGYSAAAMDALAKGFQILHKPYRPEDLERAIGNLVRARKQA